MAVDFDAAAHGRQITAEARLPEFVADDGHRALAGRPILYRQKAASERRFETERGKVVPADDLAKHALICSVNIQAEWLRRLISHQLRKDPIAVAEINIVGIRRSSKISATEIAGEERSELYRSFKR